MMSSRVAIIWVGLLGLLSEVAGMSDAPQSGLQPNILWVVTDDQRYDSIRAFNQMLQDREMSELGYVESPNVDRLTRMGTTFINTYCHSAGCAPSRAAMHYGRYPFRSGVYGFEYHNRQADHMEPTLPEALASQGYQTVQIGKLGVRLKTIKQGWAAMHPIYEKQFSSKMLAKMGLCEWGKDWFWEIDGQSFEKPFQSMEFFVTPDGEVEFVNSELEKVMPRYAGLVEQTTEKYDLLRYYDATKGKVFEKSMIISGVSPRKAGHTRDGYYVSVFRDYLKAQNERFTLGEESFEGVNTTKPLFAHIGFDFPHTPVNPPASFRERFAKKTYAVPVFDSAELETMPQQMRKLVRSKFTDNYPAEEKQKMIQDYYAFCAYGDSLVGEAVDAFIAYSESLSQPWLILYVCGDHGWKLNEHGAISKFTPWDIDNHNPIVVVSSDKRRFPPGEVVHDFTEFVDIMPTLLAAAGADVASFDYLDGYDLAKVVSQEKRARDYVVGESHHVIGPRAYIRTKEYCFSMKSRPDRKLGKNMDWALQASYEELDPGLYHMPTDPKETHNVAFDPAFREVAEQLKTKLINIVLGDGRVEVNWGAKAMGTDVFRSNFAAGADDKEVFLPSGK